MVSSILLLHYNDLKVMAYTRVGCSADINIVISHQYIIYSIYILTCFNNTRWGTPPP